ncbi:MAG: LLM class flavin-dependent oxidoreductase [Streptosporangiales bacterium]|nr:LLM class flavin-dependent oxidoreductase [Streptosporangiales bacterium]
MSVKIATVAGYWSAGPPAEAPDLFAAADRLRLDQIWTAEAWGSDAWTPLAWYGSRTSHVHLGTAVSQLSARPPATLAMTAMTMDHLTQGRVIIGIGTSNPQVVEGWYGQPYPRPLERTREYIDILRKVIAREGPVTYEGKHYQLPYAGTGLGKPLKSILHPYRTEIPIYLGAEGPKNIALAAETADGWNTMFFSPSMNDFYENALADGFGKPGARHGKDTFDVVGGPLRIIVDNDVERAADYLRPSLALYIGGMGAKQENYHNAVFTRMGYGAEAETIQRHYLAGDKAAAIKAVPTRLVEDVALVGPLAKIKEELPRWLDTVITTFTVSTDLHHLDQVVELVRETAA